MDNVTHALAGALLAGATCRLVERRSGEPSPSFRRAAFTIGVVTAELPDGDLVYSGASLGMGRLGYLLHHRGHTHTVLFAIVAALAVWAIALVVRPRLRTRDQARPLLWLSIVGLLSHVALDYTNSYGVHPFWPIDRRWFYGDAVFIVEPWFWIVALPPLFWSARDVAWRGVSLLLLAVILVASWRVRMVGTDVALALTVGAMLWAVVVRLIPPPRRIAAGLVGWLLLEGVFFTGAVAGKMAVRREVGASLRDIVLSPSPGNPLCLSALVVTELQGTYGASGATVAPWPALRTAAECEHNDRGLPVDVAGKRTDSRAIVWDGTFTAPVAELRELAANNCEIAAALRFIRVPIWRREANGAISMSDLRFGNVDGSFTSITAHPAAPCPHPVPDWEWPRHDLLGAAP